MGDYWTYHKDHEFKNKVKSEMQAAAIAVMEEVGTTENHAERVIYAKKILNGSALVEEFCIGVLMDTTIKAHVTAGTDYTDDLDTAVTSLFNAFAEIATA